MDGSDSNEGGRYSREWRPPCFSASPPKPLSEGEGSEMMVKQSIEHIEEYTASHSLTPNPSPKERGVK